MYQQYSAPRTKYRRSPDEQLPNEINESLLSLEEQWSKSKAGRKIAAFDLDNTLLIGDIGEAVFAALKMQGYIPGFGWESYRKLLATNRGEAYCSIVRALSGLTERTIHKVTLDVLTRSEDYIELDWSFIRVPRAHPLMLILVNQLRSLGYQICVISASNEISARIAAWRLFNIPPFYVYGIRQGMQQGVLTSELISPMPIGEGKVEVFRRFFGEADPAITAGDSSLDIPLLQMTDPRGFSMWVGEEKVGLDIVRQKVGASRKVCFLARPPVSQIDEDGPDR